MPTRSTEQVIRNLDQRLERVAQFLPTLTTKDELRAEVARLATKDELRAEVARLATKEELQAAIAPLATKEELRAAIAPLATKEELRAAVAPLATKEQLRAAIAPLATQELVHTLAEETRRHFDVVAESLRHDIRLVAEGQVHLASRFDAFGTEVDRKFDQLDHRLLRLEAAQPRTSGR